MKTNKLFVAIMAMAVVLFSACNSAVEPTGITLDETTWTLAVGEEITLVATVQPKGAEGTVTWASSDASVATVENGKVTGLKIGKADIVASIGGFTAKCVITVEKAKVNFGDALKGSNYYLIVMDGVTATSLGNKVVADLRPDEVTKFLYIWENTFTAGTSVGPNPYGVVEPWASLVVGTVGWSGAGYNVKDNALLNKLKTITDNANDYYLHMAIRSKSSATYMFALDGQSSAKFAIGATGFNDNGNITTPIGDFERNGEWQQIIVPVSELKTRGLLYANDMNEKNVLWFLAGGVAGTTLEFDAVFFYKK